MTAKEFLKTLQQSGREVFASPMAPKTLNAENRTVDVVWFSGGDVPRYNYMTGKPYMLRFDPKGCVMDRLNNGAPVLNCHSDWDMSDQLGVVDKAWQDGKEYLGTLRFSKRPEVDGTWQDIQDRIIQNFSMGVFIHEKKDISKDDDAMQTIVATRWEPYEISLVPVPADANTTTLTALDKPALEIARQPQSVPLSVLSRELELIRLLSR